jgi:hypothetical protein
MEAGFLSEELMKRFRGVGRATVPVPALRPGSTVGAHLSLSALIAVYGFNVAWGTLAPFIFLAFFILCAALAIPGMLMLLRVAPWHAKA